MLYQMTMLMGQGIAMGQSAWRRREAGRRERQEVAMRFTTRYWSALVGALALLGTTTLAVAQDATKDATAPSAPEQPAAILVAAAKPPRR